MTQILNIPTFTHAIPFFSFRAVSFTHPARNDTSRKFLFSSGRYVVTLARMEPPTQVFKKITEAYDVLHDKDKRQTSTTADLRTIYDELIVKFEIFADS